MLLSVYPLHLQCFPQHSGTTYLRCTICTTDFNISHGGRNDMTTHVRGKHHKDMAKASS